MQDCAIRKRDTKRDTKDRKEGHKKRATPEQKKWKEQLQERGYKSVIARGREASLEEIWSYFKEDNLEL